MFSRRVNCWRSRASFSTATRMIRSFSSVWELAQIYIHIYNWKLTIKSLEAIRRRVTDCMVQTCWTRQVISRLERAKRLTETEMLVLLDLYGKCFSLNLDTPTEEIFEECVSKWCGWWCGSWTLRPPPHEIYVRANQTLYFVLFVVLDLAFSILPCSTFYSRGHLKTLWTTSRHHFKCAMQFSAVPLMWFLPLINAFKIGSSCA